MKKLLLFICSLLPVLSIIIPSPVLADSKTLPTGDSYEQIGQKIEDFYKKNEKTSAAMETAVFDTNGTIYRGNFGYIDKEKQTKADDSTIFEWGSITKLTVWISVMQLWEEGKIDLETDIKNYLPKDFLKHLNFDKPITMLDLMNHQAGFDEQNTYLKGDKSIEELMKTRQPNQVFEPGTTTAYSNFGTGLAAYIVERISGQSFSDYTHEHIFKPLEMEKTAILPDLSDNAYVYEKHKEVKSYDANGNYKKDSDFELSLYPVGRATGTLDDLQKFAQALLKKKELFKHPETWKTLYTASSTYPGTDIPLNAHGFWYQEYGVRVIGHGGNSGGFSSYILLDLESGIGQVIMTNQFQEKIYNYKMPELVFGPKKSPNKQSYAKFHPGYYRSARTFNSGPFSFLRTVPGYTYYINEKADAAQLNGDFWVASESQGQEKITRAYGDALRQSNWDLIKDYGMLLLAGLAILFSAISLLTNAGIDLYRLILKKSQKKTSLAWKIWIYLTNAAILSIPFNLFNIFTKLMNAADADYNWNFITLAILALLLAVGSLYPFYLKNKEKWSKSKLFITSIASLSSLIMVTNILYWSLYQWWAAY